MNSELMAQLLDAMFPGVSPVERFNLVCEREALCRSFDVALVMFAGKTAGFDEYVQERVPPNQAFHQRPIEYALGMALDQERKILIETPPTVQLVCTGRMIIEPGDWFPAFEAISIWRLATEQDFGVRTKSLVDHLDALVERIPLEVFLDLSEIFALAKLCNWNPNVWRVAPAGLGNNTHPNTAYEILPLCYGPIRISGDMVVIPYPTEGTYYRFEDERFLRIAQMIEQRARMQDRILAGR